MYTSYNLLSLDTLINAITVRNFKIHTQERETPKPVSIYICQLQTAGI